MHLVEVEALFPVVTKLVVRQLHFQVFLSVFQINLVWVMWKHGTLKLGMSQMVTALTTSILQFKAGICYIVSIFEPTCANARWALMRRFPSVRLSVCPSVRLSVCRYTKSH